MEILVMSLIYIAIYGIIIYAIARQVPTKIEEKKYHEN